MGEVTPLILVSTDSDFPVSLSGVRETRGEGRTEEEEAEEDRLLRRTRGGPALSSVVSALD